MNKMSFQKGQTVYLTDGRQAEYVMADGQSHLVHIIIEVDGSYDEPPYTLPDERITRAVKVFATPPKEVVADEIAAAQRELAEVKADLIEKRKECREADTNRREIEAAAKKYPSIQQALDFIEGRITHVVSLSYHSARVLTLEEAMTDYDRWGGDVRFDGMKLLCLFGTDKNGKTCNWRVNQYRDGSGGSWTDVLPAKSEEEAKAILQAAVDGAINDWRDGQRMSLAVPSVVKDAPWVVLPDDWASDQAEKEAARKAEKIEKLRNQIEELEASA